MITYISVWERGEKQRTVGYLKMERWEETLQIEIRVKGIYGFRGAPLSVAVLTRKSGSLTESALGQMPIVDGKGELIWEGSQDRIGEASLSFAELCGCLLFVEGKRERLFLTYWGEEPFSFDWLRPAAEPVLAAAEAREEVGEEAQEEIREAAVAETVEQLAEEVREEMLSPWQELSKLFPKEVLSGQEGRGKELLRIKPQDIGRLPRENWVYGNNSFLLHGYYQYRHLVLIRDRRQSERCLLGVPGLYSSSEKQMASMFGFGEFLPAQPVEKGSCFGYWYTPVNIGNTEP